MKTLYSILESRGVVTGKNDWTELGKTIEGLHLTMRDFKPDTYNDYPVYSYVLDNIKTPVWIKSLKIVIPKPGSSEDFLMGPNALASIDRSAIKYKNGVADEVVMLYKYKYMKTDGLIFNIFQHELQHVHDIVLSDEKAWNSSYHIAPRWWTDQKYNFFDLAVGHIFNLDSIYDLFLNYTDWCHNTEVAAHGREFSIWLDNFAKTHNTLSINDMCTRKNIDVSGTAPLLMLKAFKLLSQNIDKISNDDIEAMNDGLDNNYLSKMLDKKVQISGHSRNRFSKVINYILDNGFKHVYKRYSRIIEDAMMKHPNFKVNLQQFFS